MTGEEYLYGATDENFESRNEWEFVVRVPRERSGRIEVRPQRVPNRTVWAVLDRRSLTFARATKSNYAGKVYCPIALADPTGEKSRTVASSREKDDLPRWFAALDSRIRTKATVRPTRGTDAQALVAVVAADDHQAMIRLFFATKVWVLSEGVTLRGR